MRIVDGRRHYTCFNRVNTRCYASPTLFTSLIQFTTVIERTRFSFGVLFFIIFLAQYLERNIFPPLVMKMPREMIVYCNFSQNAIFTCQVVNILTNYFIKLYMYISENWSECFKLKEWLKGLTRWSLFCSEYRKV